MNPLTIALAATPEPPWPARVDATRSDLAQYFGEQGYTTGAEIGTLRGQYAQTLCEANPALHLLAIDPWVGYAGYHDQRQAVSDRLPWIYLEATNRLRSYDCELWRMTSEDAAPKVADESLDFVFIDGNHAKPYVTQDLTLWTPKVKLGGIIAGHDYHHFTRAPYRHIQVIEAVDEFVAEHAIGPWWLLNEGTYLWRRS